MGFIKSETHTFWLVLLVNVGEKFANVLNFGKLKK
jgi:hypothetical protein